MGYEDGGHIEGVPMIWIHDFMQCVHLALEEIKMEFSGMEVLHQKKLKDKINHRYDSYPRISYP